MLSIAEECPGIPDQEVAALCAARQRILLTFDKNFGELVFRRGLPAGSGVVLFRITPDSPEEAAVAALAWSNLTPTFTDHSSSSRAIAFEFGQWPAVRSVDAFMRQLPPYPVHTTCRITHFK